MTNIDYDYISASLIEIPLKLHVHNVHVQSVYCTFFCSEQELISSDIMFYRGDPRLGKVNCS